MPGLRRVVESGLYGRLRAGRRWRPSPKPLAQLQDRSSRPHRFRRPTPQAVVEEVERLRRQRWTGKQIAATGVSPATVSRVLRRLGLNKLSALEPAEPVRRYEREHPGQLIHLDIKKLGCTGYIATIGIGRGRLFCKAWRQDRARDDGQRLVLPVKMFRAACKRLGLIRGSSNAAGKLPQMSRVLKYPG